MQSGFYFYIVKFHNYWQVILQ